DCMAGCKRHDLIATTNEERIVRDYQRACTLLDKGYNCGVDVVRRGSPHDIDLLPERNSRFLKLAYLEVVIWIARVHQRADHRRVASQSPKYFELLGNQYGCSPAPPGDVAPRPVQARDQPRRNRIAAADEDNWDAGGCGLSGLRWSITSDRSDH